jgi:hypothetical protein
MNRLDVTLARTPKVSREPATLCHADVVEAAGPPALARRSPDVLDLLFRDGL